jgi:hypothetical protein
MPEATDAQTLIFNAYDELVGENEIADDEKAEILGGPRVRAKKGEERGQEPTSSRIRGLARIRNGWRRDAVRASGRKDRLETDTMDARQTG